MATFHKFFYVMCHVVPTPILDAPPLIGQGTDDQAEMQLAHHQVLVGMHIHLGLGYDVAHRVKELVKGCHTRPWGCSYVV